MSATCVTWTTVRYETVAANAWHPTRKLGDRPDPTAATSVAATAAAITAASSRNDHEGTSWVPRMLAAITVRINASATSDIAHAVPAPESPNGGIRSAF